MVLVTLASVSSSSAYKATELSETHDSGYVKSLELGAKNSAEVNGPAADFAGQPEAIETPAELFGAPTPSTNPPGVSTGKAPKESPDRPAPEGLDLEGRPLAALPTLPVTAPVQEATDVMEIDNDLYGSRSKKGSKQPFAWEDVKSEDGKTVIRAGARFPVVLVSSHTSRTCKIGDRVEARLKSDIYIDDRLVAKEHDRVVGHVASAHKARRVLIAQLAPKRWMRANGAIGIKFDEFITYQGEHVPLTAAPARMARIIANKAEGRVLGVNHKGELVAPLSTQLKNQGVQLALRGAAGAGGVFSMGAVPVVFGLIGAAHPSFAFLHPVGQNLPHRRLKGFGMGFLSGLPGGFIIADWFLRGVESVLKPGDQFLVEFHQDFNGEAASTAQLQPQERMKVKAEIARKKAKPARKKSRTTTAGAAN